MLRNPFRDSRIVPAGVEASSGAPRSPEAERGTGVVTKTRAEPRTKVKKPNLYRVVLHNDDYTTQEFVVMVLQSIFNKSPQEAIRIMLLVHRSGAGVAGVYTYEVAETKVAAVIALARQHEFPLLCTMEPE